MTGNEPSKSQGIHLQRSTDWQLRIGSAVIAMPFVLILGHGKITINHFLLLLLVPLLKNSVSQQI